MVDSSSCPGLASRRGRCEDFWPRAALGGYRIGDLPAMAKRLGELLAVLGWVLGGLAAWTGFQSQDQVQGLTAWTIFCVAALPVFIGHMCYYVLAGVNKGGAANAKRQDKARGQERQRIRGWNGG